MCIIPESNISYLDKSQQLILLNEVESAYRLIISGFSELQNSTKPNLASSLEQLTQGIEKFLKTYLCIANYHIYEQFLKNDHFQQKGNTIDSLLGEILNRFYFKFDRPQFELDIDFLKHDRDLKELINILSNPPSSDNDAQFSNTLNRSQNILFNDLYFDKKDKSSELSLKRNQEVSFHCVIILEKMLAALSRQFIFKSFGLKGLQLASVLVFDFGMLYPQDYGKKIYKYAD